MAKRQKTTRFSIQAFDNAHYRTTEQYTRAVDALFDVATMEISQAAAKGKIDPEKPFSFDDYPKIKGVMQNVTAQLADRLTTTIESGSKNQWLFACKKNDRFIASIMDTSKLSKAQLNKMQDQNLDALKAFQGRKVEGLNLSERVWKYVGQYQEQMESALDAGLGEGRSAQQLAREVKQNLNDPNRLFRRVRDKRGNLVLSKAARAFHPGRGVYRSSVKNAQRLTRSEINMSYRESDWQRWQSLDFIVGFEVVRSNHEPLCDCDICSQLVGRYPKTFKFVGWHPQCMCYAIPILMDEKTFEDNELGDLKAALRGTTYKHKQAANTVPDVPDGFKDWVKDHIEAQRKWASTPYFIRDNFKNGDLSKGLKIVLPTIQKVAIALFKGNTPQEIKDFIIQNIADSCTIEIKARDLDLWNDIVNQLNVRMQQFGLKKFGNIGVPRSKAAEASWDSFGNNFNLNMTAVRNKSAIKKAAAWKKRGVMYSFAYEDSDDYVRALIDHELGHAILNGYAKMADVASLMSKVGMTITVNGKPFNPINDVLGYYASTEEHEFFAEAFSFYMGKNRDKLDDRIKEYFEQLFAKNGFKLEANAGQQIDPVQRELDLLQPQIAAIRQMCAEWGIDSNSLDVAISMRNPNAIVSAINTLKDRVYKSMDELKAYIADATATIKKAKGHDIDAIDVLNDLQGINADKRKWTMEKASILNRLQNLKNKIQANIQSDDDVIEVKAPDWEFKPDKTKATNAERLSTLLDNVEHFYGKESRFQGFIDSSREKIANGESEKWLGYELKSWTSHKTLMNGQAKPCFTSINHLQELKGISSASIPAQWRKMYNDAIKVINEHDFVNKGYESIYAKIEKAYNIYKLASLKEVREMGFDNVSPNMPYNIFTEYKKKIPGMMDTLPSKGFFDSLKDFVPLVALKSGAHYSPTYRYVNISFEKDNIERMTKSPWYRKGLFYHEFGHAFDHQIKLKAKEDLVKVYNDWKISINSGDGEKLKKAVQTKLDEFNADFDKFRDDAWKQYQELKRIGKTEESERLKKELFAKCEEQESLQMEFHEKLGAFTDCLQAAIDGHKFIQPRGHDVKYWTQDKQLAEFIAHCSENYWGGNPIFKEIAPQLYDDMRKIIEKYMAKP